MGTPESEEAPGETDETEGPLEVGPPDMAVVSNAVRPQPGAVGRAVFDRAFGDRVRALLRTRPVAAAAAGAARQPWGRHGYDLSSLALAAIDTVISRQGFDEEVTYEETIAALAALAASTRPDRPFDEHDAVSRYVVDALLNRRERETPFRYPVSVFAVDEAGALVHRQMPAEFWLLTEHEDTAREVTVLRASTDAINALVGGLEFDVRDEQAANELMLARQLERNAFDQAEKSAQRASMLSAKYAEEMRGLLADTVRDIRAVLERWAGDIPALLDRNRKHLQERRAGEMRFLKQVKGVLEGTGVSNEVAATAARIIALLEECRDRHTELHGRLVNARTTFLDEQARQSFRPLGGLRNPDLTDTVFLPLLRLPTADALEPAEHFAVLVSGPLVPPVPRLADLVDDLLAPRRPPVIDDGEEIDEITAEDDPPEVPRAVLDHANAVVTTTGLPCRLSTLLAAAAQATPPPGYRVLDVQRVLALTALWTYAPEAMEDDSAAVDAAALVLGTTAAVDADGTRLTLPGWYGDDLIIAPDEESLAHWAAANPQEEP